MHEYFTCMYICEAPLFQLPMESRRGHYIPWTWRYRWLWATMQVLGTEPGSSREQSFLFTTLPSLQPLIWNWYLAHFYRWRHWQQQVRKHIQWTYNLYWSVSFLTFSSWSSHSTSSQSIHSYLFYFPFLMKSICPH